MFIIFFALTFFIFPAYLITLPNFPYCAPGQPRTLKPPKIPDKITPSKLTSYKLPYFTSSSATLPKNPVIDPETPIPTTNQEPKAIPVAIAKAVPLPLYLTFLILFPELS